MSKVTFEGFITVGEVQFPAFQVQVVEEATGLPILDVVSCDPETGAVEVVVRNEDGTPKTDAAGKTVTVSQVRPFRFEGPEWRPTPHV